MHMYEFQNADLTMMTIPYNGGNIPGGGLPIKSDGGSECWVLPLTLKYKKKFLFLTTLEYIFLPN